MPLFRDYQLHTHFSLYYISHYGRYINWRSVDWAGVIRSSRFGFCDRTALLYASLRALWAIGRHDGIQDKSGERGRQRTEHLWSGVCAYYSAVC